MARVTFTETYEKGNHLTGEYERWTRCAEFEGEVEDVWGLIDATSNKMSLPAVTTYERLQSDLVRKAEMSRLIPAKRGDW